MANSKNISATIYFKRDSEIPAISKVRGTTSQLKKALEVETLEGITLTEFHQKCAAATIVIQPGMRGNSLIVQKFYKE